MYRTSALTRCLDGRVLGLSLFLCSVFCGVSHDEALEEAGDASGLRSALDAMRSFLSQVPNVRGKT